MAIALGRLFLLLCTGAVVVSAQKESQAESLKAEMEQLQRTLMAEMVVEQLQKKLMAEVQGLLSAQQSAQAAALEALRKESKESAEKQQSFSLTLQETLQKKEEIASSQNSLNQLAKKMEEALAAGLKAQAQKITEESTALRTALAASEKKLEESALAAQAKATEEMASLRTALTAAEKKAEEGQAAQAALTAKELEGDLSEAAA
eukprot:s8633_g2.t1